MSASTGAPSGRPDSSKTRARRPSLDRPSLFAGMEDDVTDIEPERIRILSSLEPRPAVAPRRRKSSPTATPRWWSHVLLGLMGMGLFTVALAVFLLVKSSAEPDLSVGGDWSTPDAALMDPDATLAANPPAAGTLSAEVAEAETFGLLHASAPEASPASSHWQDMLNNDPVGTSASAEGTSGGARIEPLDVASTPVTSEAVPTTGPKAEVPRTTTLTPSSVGQPTPPINPTKAASSKSATSPAAASLGPSRPVNTSTGSHAASASNADVSLLEAVFPKHDPRTASKADLFKACQGMSGAESAICRARICVQHPGVPACQ